MHSPYGISGIASGGIMVGRDENREERGLEKVKTFRQHQNQNHYHSRPAAAIVQIRQGSKHNTTNNNNSNHHHHTQNQNLHSSSHNHRHHHHHHLHYQPAHNQYTHHPQQQQQQAHKRYPLKLRVPSNSRSSPPSPDTLSPSCVQPPRNNSKSPSSHHRQAAFGQASPTSPLDQSKWEGNENYNHTVRQVSPQMNQRGSPELLQNSSSEDVRNGPAPGSLKRTTTDGSIGSPRLDNSDNRQGHNQHKNSPGRSGSNTYQNPQPRGLRVRVPSVSHQAPGRGRTNPDSDEQKPSHKKSDSGGSPQLIQMPLAFNSIARSRTVTSTPSTSLPDLKAHNARPTGRRPSILKDEAQKVAQRSQRTKNNSARRFSPGRVEELQHQSNHSHHRRVTPSPPNSRSREGTPPPGNYSHSPTEIRGSFRSALQHSRLHDHRNGTTEQRSSVATADSTLTSSSLEMGEMSVEDAIGMYESDDDDHDPTQNPVIDRQQRTGSGTPVGSRNYSYEGDRRPSPSRIAEILPEDLLNNDEHVEETHSPILQPIASPIKIISNVELLEAELEEAQNTPRTMPPLQMQSTDHEVRENVISTPVTDKPTNGFDPIISNGDTPPKNPPRDPSGSEPRDQYGFRKKSQWISLEEYDNWYKTYDETLVRRQKKWQILLKESGLQPGEAGPIRFPPRSTKVKRFVRKGIPPEWRGAAWFWYAGGRTHLQKHPGLYEKLVSQKALPDSEAPELIERDLHRTFPDNIHFKPEQPVKSTTKAHKRQSTSKVFETPMVKSLRRVLLAFALYVPRIGYCQSLNFWAGMLLLFMDEEKAFWMLYIITHQYLPGTHDTSLEGSNIDQGVLMMSVRESVPQVWQKISVGLDGSPITLSNAKLPDITLCTASWLMSGFISNLPVETVLRVWDSFFYEGSKILFRISLALFKAAEGSIRNLSDPIDVFQVIQTTPRKFIDAGALMDLCFKRRNGYGHLSQQQIDDRRKERRVILENEVKRRADGHEDIEALPRGSKDDMALRKMFGAAAGNFDDATTRFKKYYQKKK